MKWVNAHNGCGCGYCSVPSKYVGGSNCLATRNPELAKEWHPTLNGDLTPCNVTCGSHNSTWWQCKNGHEWENTIYGRIIGGNMIECPYCSGYSVSKENNLLINNPILCEDWDYDKNDKRPEEYTFCSGQYVWWICKECGYEWTTTIDNRNGGSHCGCPDCSKSKGEIKINEYMKCNNISYTPQKEFDGLLGLGNGNLSYDFYLPQYNILIEYQGEYHDRVIKYKNETIEFAEYRFKKQREHDKYKKEYAISKHINLLEIWYWDFDNYRRYIK